MLNDGSPTQLVNAMFNYKRHLMHKQKQQSSFAWLSVVAFGKYILMSVKCFLFFFPFNSTESAENPLQKRKIFCHAVWTICSVTRCFNIIILTFDFCKRYEWHIPHCTWHRENPKRWIAAEENYFKSNTIRRLCDKLS